MISSDRMAAVDRNAAALGVPRKQLMESSGNAVARVVRDVADPPASVAVVAGRGNNGGDAFVAARFLDAYDVTVTLLGRPDSLRTTIARENFEALRAADYEVETVTDSGDLDLGDPDVVVDGMLGTGVTGALREPERTAAAAINDTDATVVAVDVPSGEDADTGAAAGEAVAADHVVTFHDVKPGLIDRDDCAVTVADIGIPPAAERFVGPGDLQVLTGRAPESHKGSFGRVLVVGGGPYAGAPALAGRAALRAGADLAFLAVPEAVAAEVQGFGEDLIVRPYDGDALTGERVPSLLAEAQDCDAVVVGPGLGSNAATRDAARTLLAEFDGRAVVDADALAVVPEVDTDATLLCTPHRGELVDMGGPDLTDPGADAAAVADFAADLGQAVLAKGPRDVIADGDDYRVNRTGNPGMTVGGTGDVLAGVSGALLARFDTLTAGALAAYANGRAGDEVHEERGDSLLASDLVDALPAALRDEGAG